ncbi:transglutaminase-like domain-containing protein [Kroppenstedtia eburnea]|uniref:Transglutaminase-like superfamily protein n=1 Tax=Kroppenstedtia eburnea TaxID=714067 RepID=A0A1N7NJD4_9BACL|nr:transglutaminase-like domain-containing protein [Kroppenstedtia eburnea]QKI80975.1 transglutaminase domain-containing protein [Kroppenstedtia eburnea]SIS98454.1 Transglutaminase-like superfamily protein [Kroppenstedtia eburnea]
MKKILLTGGILLVVMAVITTAGCNPMSAFETEAEPNLSHWDRVAAEKNEQLPLTKLKLKPYADEVSAALSSPRYQRFAVNSHFRVAGTVKEYEEFQSEFVWIEVEKVKGGKETGEKDLSFYTHIKDGKFSRQVSLFAGEGEYRVTVRLPSAEREDRFYDLARFHVINVNPEIDREVAMTRAGLQAGLKLEAPGDGYVQTDGEIRLKGSIEKGEARRVMVRVEKGGKEWKHLLRLQEGSFDTRIPLFYGKGIHKLTVMTPDPEREDYYNEGATLLAHNRSPEEKSPIEYFKHYDSRGIKLEHPLAGGGKGEMKYRIKGSIDPEAPFAAKTKHLIVQTKKGGLEATYFIPVKNYRFDGSFWLRFGKGAYEVTVNVPEITDQQRDYFRFFGVARFTVNNTADQDLRNLLPSRGIQSNHPSIQNLARDLTRGKQTEREKALAIYAYVAQNIRYDVWKFRTDAFKYDDSAIKALRQKKGVCQDYSFLAIALLRSIDMEARFVEGVADGNRHAWVEVKADGKWITMDPTWGSGYTDSRDRFVKRYTTKYFDPNPAEFAKTHRRTGVMY